MAKDITQHMPIDIDAWLSSTNISGMSAEEERGYMHLLFTAWKQPNCGLPDDDDLLCRWAKLSLTKWRKSGPRIRRCFFVRDGYLFNTKQIFERERLERDQQSRIKGGSLSASVRYSSNGSSASSSATVEHPIQLGVQLDSSPYVRTSSLVDSTSTTENKNVLNDDERLVAREIIGKSLQAYMHGFLEKEPDTQIVDETIAAGMGASAVEINAYLCKLYDSQPPGSRRGPRSYAWFPVVVRAHFDKRRSQ